MIVLQYHPQLPPPPPFPSPPPHTSPPLPAQIMEKVSSKLRGAHYYTVRHAFRVFDPQGQGNVTQQALFRIMYNQGLVSNQVVFQALLNRCVGVGVWVWVWGVCGECDYVHGRTYLYEVVCGLHSTSDLTWQRRTSSPSQSSTPSSAADRR